MNRYKLLSQLGEQSQGFISQAENIETGEKVVIKQYKKKFYTWQDCMMQREIKVLRIFSHPNIVKLKELIKEGHTLYSVYEFTDQNLFEFYQNLRDSNGTFTETEIKSIMYQIFSGLHYTHKMHYFHRDLCLENIFINHDSQEVKISNFSQSKEIQYKGQLTDYITTRWYRAPEQLLHSQNYNYKVDLWAAGCIMAELFLLGPLFGGSSESDQLWRIIKIMGTPTDWPDFYSLINNLTKKQGSVPKYDPQNLSQIIPNASPEAIDLLKKLLVFNPQKRYSGLQALKHPFFTGQSLQSGQNTPNQQYKSPQNNNNANNQKPSYFSQKQQESLEQSQNTNNNNTNNPDQENSNSIHHSQSQQQQQQQQQQQLQLQQQEENRSQRASGRVVPGAENIDDIQEEQQEEDAQSQDSQSNQAVPLDIQQHQMQLKRPGSRDCNRGQKDQNAQIKHEKEMGSIQSGSNDLEEDQVQDLEFNDNLRNNNDIIINVTHGKQDITPHSFTKNNSSPKTSFVPMPRKSQDLSSQEINDIVNKYKGGNSMSSSNNQAGQDIRSPKSSFAREQASSIPGGMVEPIVKISDEGQINEEEEDNQSSASKH